MEKPFVFVLMPFADRLADEYALAIKPACEAAGARCERVDEQIFHENILERIYEQITQATLIVAEISETNANVFYELGFAHGVGKPVVLVTRSVSLIPFDLRQYPHVIFGESLTTLRARLEERVKWCIEHPSKIPSIIQRAIGHNDGLVRGRDESMADFFDGVTATSRLDVEVAIKEGGHVVFYYSKPLRVHVRRMEFFAEEGEFVIYSERNTRRSIGLPLTPEVARHLRDQKEIHLVRLSLPAKEPLSEITVPFTVYRGKDSSENVSAV